VSYRGSFDRTAAAILSLILITLSLLIVAVESRSRRRADYHRIHSGGGRRTLVIPLGAWRWAVFVGCTLLLAISLGIPVVVIGYWLFRGTTGANAIGTTLAAAFNTIRAAAAGTFLCLLAAWPVAALSVRHPGRMSRFIETSSFVGYALPGLVVALSLVFLTARWVPFLYQGLALLALAYAVLFLPQAVGAMRASLLQVSPQHEEAARTLGAGRAGTFFKVVLPLVRPGVLAGSALVFLTAMKELPATLLLSPPGFATLATRVWGATTDAFFARAAAPALALIALSSLPLTFLVLKERTQEKSGVARNGG
jgi:iron(III) transport system permease protein